MFFTAVDINDSFSTQEKSQKTCYLVKDKLCFCYSSIQSAHLIIFENILWLFHEMQFQTIQSCLVRTLSVITVVNPVEKGVWIKLFFLLQRYFLLIKAIRQEDKRILLATVNPNQSSRVLLERLTPEQASGWFYNSSIGEFPLVD